jgi:trans-aconitate methyltransferase
MKNTIKSIVAQLGLEKSFLYLSYWVQKLKNAQRNRAFKKEHPEVVLPDDFTMFEAFGLDYYNYYNMGLASAQDLLQQVSAFVDVNRPIRMLDWGCGPARITRHLPQLLAPGSVVMGTDYNQHTISWCNKALAKEGLAFYLNAAAPPLHPDIQQMDWVLSISVVTHLPDHLIKAWFNAIHAAMCPKGVMLFSFQGKVYEQKLEKHELTQLLQTGCFCREHDKEGTQLYQTFHTAQYMSKILQDAGFSVLQHIPGKTESWGIEQDVMIVSA